MEWLARANGPPGTLIAPRTTDQERPLASHQQLGSWDGRGVSLPRAVHTAGDVRGARESVLLVDRVEKTPCFGRRVDGWMTLVGREFVPWPPQGGLRVSEPYWRLPRPDARLLAATGRIFLCVSSRWYIKIQSGGRRSVERCKKSDRRSS